MLLHIEIMKCFTESLFSSWMPIAGSNLTLYKLQNFWPFEERGRRKEGG